MNRMYVFAISSLWSLSLYAQSNSASIDKLRKQIQEWVAAGCLLGLTLAVGIIVCAYWFKMKFFQHLADEYQKSLFWGLFITVVAGIFRSEIADIIARMSNPLGL